MIRVAAIMQVRNENTIISHQLDVLSLLCDKIIVVDDSSSDSTRERIRYHKNSKNIYMIKNHQKKRNEGGLFNIAMEKARSFAANRIYIADADEVIPPQFINTASKLLRNTNKNIRLHRAEICLDQHSCYGLEGTGKLVFVNSNAKFGTNTVIHQSQPNMPNQVLIPANECCLLHYGTCDYSYQVFKCLSYMIWENMTQNKPLEQGYNEYFKTYKNFVFSGKHSLGDFVWNGEYGISSPIPYSHYMEKEAREICAEVNVMKDFDFESLADSLRKNKFASDYIYKRA